MLGGPYITPAWREARWTSLFTAAPPRRGQSAARSGPDRTLGWYAEITAEKIDAAKSEILMAGQAERDRLGATNSQLRSDLEKERASRSVNGQNADPVKPQPHTMTLARLGDEKIAALVKALRGSVGNDLIDYDGGDVTTAPLSTQLQSAFRDAGWNVSSGIRIGVSAPPKSGLLVRANKGSMTAPQERAVGALKTANIAFDLRLDRELKPSVAGRGMRPPEWVRMTWRSL